MEFQQTVLTVLVFTIISQTTTGALLDGVVQRTVRDIIVSRDSDGASRGPLWQHRSLTNCQTFLSETHQDHNAGWCPGVWDEVLCWPATANGTSASQPCPVMQGTDSTKSANRACLAEGKWALAPTAMITSVQQTVGYTEYDDCFTSDTSKMFSTFLSNT